MKLEVNVEKIKKGIYQAERVTGKNLTLPVLGSVLFVAKKGTLRLRATNLNLGIEVEIPAKVSEEGELAAPGRVLAEIFTGLSGDSLLLEGVGGNLLLKTKKNKIKIKGEPADDFPTIPVVSGTSLKVEAKKLIEGIKSVYWSASTSDVKPEVSSVYVYGDGDNLIHVATDSFRLAERKIKARGAGELSLLLPFRNVPEILRVLSEIPGEITLSFNKNQISFSGENVYLTSRVINGIFPDYRQIIPKESKTEAVLLKDELLNALKLSNVFSGKFNQVNLKVVPKEKIFELSSEQSDVGENKTELDGALSGEPVELSFNYRYFLDCFSAIGSDSVTLKFDGANRPIVVLPNGDTTFKYLIMPMNR